jgi:hypothetical protein
VLGGGGWGREWGIDRRKHQCGLLLREVSHGFLFACVFACVLCCAVLLGPLHSETLSLRSLRLVKGSKIW